MKQAKYLALLCMLITILATGCTRSESAEEVEGTAQHYNETASASLQATGEGDEYGILSLLGREDIENLALLGKVWGFVKYTHYIFITGQLDWDAELFRLVPLVLEGGDVRNLLYDWFVGLGEDGYDFYMPADQESKHEFVVRSITDLSWINYDFLGALATHLLRFDGIRITERTRAPVFFTYSDTLDFSNQRTHPFMNFESPEYRLLGLFRLWNAMNYYFPHLDALDVNWNDMLVKFIPKMLEGTDRLSYELTLARLAHHLHDVGVFFQRATFFDDKFGRYVAPVQLISSEGRFVVYGVPAAGEPLQRGDIILSVNGRDIGEIISEMRHFLSYPNDEKALAYLSGLWLRPSGFGASDALRSHERVIYIEVLRGIFGMTHRINGQSTFNLTFPQLVESHKLLDNNIGFINPSVQEDVGYIMENFASTDGLIIDLRQNPHNGFIPTMLTYLLEKPNAVLKGFYPSQVYPGKQYYFYSELYIPQNPYAFMYGSPIVLLMDGQSSGTREWAIMSLRAAQNVTVIGPYSLGALGITTPLPLPGGFWMRFTSTGVFKPDGERLFRNGIIPDIRVDRTIAGIAEGRDEILEAAIRFILDAEK